jgi:heterodisulfide reductase subunit A-like polyferredoxin
VAVNPHTLAASRPGVFAAGDVTTGTAFVIEAVQAGHQAAESIHRYIRGKELESPPKPKLPVVELVRADIDERVARGEVKPQPRVPMDRLPPTDRRGSFDEVVAGYTDEKAQAEAARCLACGVCSECLSCQYTCQADAIVHDATARTESVQVGAMILAPGFEPFAANRLQEYGFGRYHNVVTSLQFERLLSASGPTFGHVNRPGDGQPAKRIAFLQCIGSRDADHDYCSSVCCMYATKEAIMAIEHDRETEAHIFMMDMRSFSKGYDEYYRRARDKCGVRYTRCRVSAVRENRANGNLIIRYVSEDAPEPERLSLVSEKEFDLVVLSVGMEVAASARELTRRLGVDLDRSGFCRTEMLEPLQTSHPGVFVVGPFREPKDIPETVVEASGAAGAVAGLLQGGRWTLTREKEYPPARRVDDEEPRVGVFVCHCGSNIGGYLDVPAVTEYAATLPSVAHAENNLYTCSQDSIARISQRVQELGLNRVVVAACTPLTHEPLFQDSLRSAGLNPYLFDMANIRNQCSWVHGDDWDAGTGKAKDLVRMAVARASLLEPLSKTVVPVQKRALVIGGGPAGMHASLALAKQGIAVTLVEREAELGGNLRRLRYLADVQHSEQPVALIDARAYLNDLVREVTTDPLIEVRVHTQLVSSGGFKGNFRSVLRSPDSQTEIEHGATIIATGGQEHRGPEYRHGADPRIMTLFDFEARLADWEDGPLPERPELPGSVVVILCAGSPADRYCSRVCCAAALKNILALKQLNPDVQVTVFYRDIRTFGFKERLYTEARRQRVLFVRYDDDRRPVVDLPADGKDLTVTGREPVLKQDLVLYPDLVVLAMPMVPAGEAGEMARTLKAGQDLDGWIMEAHVKLRPVDLATEGLYVAGCAHYPKFVEEVIAQAQAAAGRAMTVLSRDWLEVGGVVAKVDSALCVGCLTCVRICPFNVPTIDPHLAGVGGIAGAAVIEPALCQGCGICVGECPAKAIRLQHYQDEQLRAKIATFWPAEPVPA